MVELEAVVSVPTRDEKTHAERTQASELRVRLKTKNQNTALPSSREETTARDKEALDSFLTEIIPLLAPV